MSADGSAASAAAEGSPHQANMSPSQQLSASASTPVQSVAQTNVGGDSLVCQWASCGERTSTAELLYDHVCERHVGRKSTNNLNLTCQWGNCRTTTVKRDHITSHIRVHVPLKPHKCDFCGKAFKRPQDLKKHVKTHADDSVLLRSPEPSRASQNGPGGGYQPANSTKLVADLQTLAATASGYYPDHSTANGNYYQNGLGTGSYHSAAAAPAGSAYGPVYYAVNQAAGMATDYEVRKRAAFDALNEFFGDAKRRVIDPATYYDVGHRLAMGGLQPAMVSSAAAAAGGYSGADSYGTPAAHLPQQHYTLPLPNLRTKNDLLNIDHFLEQLQSTVYENSNGAAAAGVHQAGAHYIPTGMGYGRSSHSPPTVGHPSTSSLGASNVLAPLATPQTDTPALTPASSVMSYGSGAGHSPPSQHASHGLSPTRSTASGLNAPMYPTLPAVSAMSDMNVGAGYSTSGAPASSLASGFDADGRRRYSGGLLQRQAPTRASVEPMDEDTPTGSPKAPLDSGADGEESKSTPTLNVSMIDPSMRSPSAKSEDAAEGTPSREESQQEQWVENIRMIEALRELVKNRLEAGEFESEEASADNAGEASKDVEMGHDDVKTEQDKDAESLYPVLRAIQED